MLWKDGITVSLKLQGTGTRHPRFLVFVDQLKNEQQKTEDDIEISISGVEKRKKSAIPATMTKFVF